MTAMKEVHGVQTVGWQPVLPLLRQIKDAGLLERRTGHYTPGIAVTTALLAG